MTAGEMGLMQDRERAALLLTMLLSVTTKIP